MHHNRLNLGGPGMISNLAFWLADNDYSHFMRKKRFINFRHLINFLSRWKTFSQINHVRDQKTGRISWEYRQNFVLVFEEYPTGLRLHIQQNNPHIPNIDAISGALTKLNFSIFIMNSQCEGGARDNIGIWYMGITSSVFRNGFDHEKRTRVRQTPIKNEPNLKEWVKLNGTRTLKNQRTESNRYQRTVSFFSPLQDSWAASSLTPRPCIFNQMVRPLWST